MSPTLIGLTWAIVSALCLGIGTFLYKVSSSTLGASNTTFFYYLFSVILASAVWFITPEREPVQRTNLNWPALMAFFLCASVWTFSSAVRTIDISVASTIRGVSIVPAVLLAVGFDGERLTPKASIALLLMLGAVVLLGFDDAKRVE